MATHKVKPGNGWMTLPTLAKLEGIGEETARSRAKRGKYDVLKDGHRRLYRFKEPRPNAPDTSPDTEPVSDDTPAFYSLDDAKKKKLAVDIEIGKLKVEKLRQEIQADYCRIMTDAFTKAFTPLKQALIDLDLSKRQIKDLSELIDRCLEEFGAQVDRALAKEQAGGDDTEDEE